jgi:NAD(P)H-flavin reductase
MRGDLAKQVYRARCRQPCEFLYRTEIMGWLDRPDLDIQLTADQCDETWTCATGLVTSIMNSACVDPGNAVGVSCGPPVMMKFVTLKMLEMGIPPERIYLSMEKNMSCGFGKCGQCRLEPSSAAGTGRSSPSTDKRHPGYGTDLGRTKPHEHLG